MISVTCSECGSSFIIEDSLSYLYKLSNKQYQCSYTCYEHAKLNKSDYCYEPKIKTNEYIMKSEILMALKGKKIRNPIKFKKITKKDIMEYLEIEKANPKYIQHSCLSCCHSTNKGDLDLNNTICQSCQESNNYQQFTEQEFIDRLKLIYSQKKG